MHQISGNHRSNVSSVKKNTSHRIDPRSISVSEYNRAKNSPMLKKTNPKILRSALSQLERTIIRCSGKLHLTARDHWRTTDLSQVRKQKRPNTELQQLMSSRLRLCHHVTILVYYLDLSSWHRDNPLVLKHRLWWSGGMKQNSLVRKVNCREGHFAKYMHHITYSL